MSRDRTCQFTGCWRTRPLQAHHIEHWAKGGETNPENLMMLCRTHHWAVHEGGFRVEGRTPQGIAFLRPDGSLLPVCPHRVPINGKGGETLDYHMAVDALLSYDDDSIDEECF